MTFHAACGVSCIGRYAERPRAHRPARTEALMTPYTTPILRRLGTLADLTKNGGGSWKQPKESKTKTW